MPRVAPQQLELEPVRHEPLPEPTRSRRTDPKRSRHAARDVKRSPGKPDFPRLALTFAESAAMLGVSDEFFAQYVAHEVRFVRRGRKKLVAVRELERWLEESASRELR
jgi:hypothetical protein